MMPPRAGRLRGWLVGLCGAAVGNGGAGGGGPARPAAPRLLDVGELLVVDDFLEGEELDRASGLIPRGSKKSHAHVVLNASTQGYLPADADRDFFQGVLEKIRAYADAYVHPVPDSTDPYPFKGRYFIDSWTLRRYIHEHKEKRVQVHTDTEQPGRCLSASLYLTDESGIEGGVLEGYKCPPTVNCRRLVMQDAYKPFAREDAVLEVAAEAAYKRGRIVFFLASTPHAVSELKTGLREVLFVWIGCYPTLRSVGDENVANVRKLIEERADVNGGFARGMTPLHFSVVGGHKPITELLLENRANPNAEEYYLGRTPLFAAAESGSANVVDKLVEFRGDMCLTNTKGVTPLQEAVSKKQDSVRDRLVALGAGRCPPGQPRSGKGRRPRPSVPTQEALNWYRHIEEHPLLLQQRENASEASGGRRAHTTTTTEQRSLEQWRREWVAEWPAEQRRLERAASATATTTTDAGFDTAAAEVHQQQASPGSERWSGLRRRHPHAAAAERAEL